MNVVVSLAAMFALVVSTQTASAQRTCDPSYEDQGSGVSRYTHAISPCIIEAKWCWSNAPESTCKCGKSHCTGSGRKLQLGPSTWGEVTLLWRPQELDSSVEQAPWVSSPVAAPPPSTAATPLPQRQQPQPVPQSNPQCFELCLAQSTCDGSVDLHACCQKHCAAARPAPTQQQTQPARPTQRQQTGATEDKNRTAPAPRSSDCSEYCRLKAILNSHGIYKNETNPRLRACGC